MTCPWLNHMKYCDYFFPSQMFTLSFITHSRILTGIDIKPTTLSYEISTFFLFLKIRTFLCMWSHNTAPVHHDSSRSLLQLQQSIISLNSFSTLEYCLARWGYLTLLRAAKCSLVQFGFQFSINHFCSVLGLYFTLFERENKYFLFLTHHCLLTQTWLISWWKPSRGPSPFIVVSIYLWPRLMLDFNFPITVLARPWHFFVFVITFTFCMDWGGSGISSMWALPVRMQITAHSCLWQLCSICPLPSVSLLLGSCPPPPPPCPWCWGACFASSGCHRTNSGACGGTTFILQFHETKTNAELLSSPLQFLLWWQHLCLRMCLYRA